MNNRLVVYGFIGWLIATIALRFSGQRLLHPGSWMPTVILFAISFSLCAFLIRFICRAAKLARERWPGGALSIALPTLLLDPFSSAFFPTVFPNIAPQMAGVFGGWMLVCCAGAFVGAALPHEQAR